MKKMIVFMSLWVLFAMPPCFAKPPLNDWNKYCGSFVCWDAAYDPSSVPPGFGQPVNPKETPGRKSLVSYDEFENFPFINIRTAKNGKVIAELWGYEKTGDREKKGFYRIVVSKLNIKPDGQISFEVGERVLYSKPMGWKIKRGVQIGVKKSKMVYSGKIRGKYEDDICLTCKGDDCFKGKRVFSRNHP